MYKDQPFNFSDIPIVKFDASERQLVRHIFGKFLSNKIFYQQFSDSRAENKPFRRIERSFNLRASILYFYCNPLYKHAFNRNTISGLYAKLKQTEQNILKKLPDSETKHTYFIKDSGLPVFLLHGSLKSNSGSFDLKTLYSGILERENIPDNESFRLKFLKLYTILSFAIRLPLIHIFRTIKFRNKVINLIGHIENINTLWKTINKMSFQMNFLVFNKGLREIIRGKTEIVDLSILVMLIGDDFIDQIARNQGCEKIISIISQKKDAFGIKINVDHTLQSNDLVSLYKMLHIEREKVSDIENMTFEQLYDVMLDLFSEINRRLLKMSITKRKTACEAIRSFLNYCLSTYMDDLLFSTMKKAEKFSLKDIDWYFYKKNNCVMMYGLWLRAVLLELNYEHYLPQISEWGNLVGNIQLYDDLKDIKADWSFQPNYPIILSFEYFFEEHEWFEKNMDKFHGCYTPEEIFELSVAMPKTVAHTILLSKYMGISQLDWFTKFATNYCWKQNWNNAFIHFKGFTKTPGYDLSNHRIFDDNTNRITTLSKEVNLVFLVLSKTHSLFEVVTNKEFYFDYLLMLCLYDRNFSKIFYLRTNISHTYNLVFRFQFMKTGYKSQLLTRFMKHHKVEVIHATDQYKQMKTQGTLSFSADMLEYIRENWI